MIPYFDRVMAPLRKNRSVVQFGQSSHIANLRRYLAGEFIGRQIQDLEISERIDALRYLASQVVVSEVSIKNGPG